MFTRLKEITRTIALSVLRKLKAYRKRAYILKGEVGLSQLQNTEIRNLKKYAPVKRVAPLTLDNDLYWKFEQQLTVTPQQTFVIKANDWRVWGNQGAVITNDDDLFKEVSREFEKTDHSIFKQLKLITPTKLNGTTAVINASGADMYYHWLFDILPRIKLLNDAGYTSDKIDRYIINYRDIPFQEEALLALGITKEKISRANDHFNYHILAEQLLVPSLPSRLDEVAAEACTFLRDTFLDKTKASPTGKKIYLKRTGKRKLTNNDEIETYLNNHGFESVQCEHYTISEQAAIFYNADILIGPHGAAFSNVVFCKPGTKVIEFFSPKWINPCYWTICNSVSAPYYYVIGENGEPDKHSNAEGTNEDITLSIDKLKQLISSYQILN